MLIYATSICNMYVVHTYKAEHTIGMMNVLNIWRKKAREVRKDAEKEAGGGGEGGMGEGEHRKKDDGKWAQNFSFCLISTFVCPTQPL